MKTSNRICPCCKKNYCVSTKILCKKCLPIFLLRVRIETDKSDANCLGIYNDMLHKKNLEK